MLWFALPGLLGCKGARPLGDVSSIVLIPDEATLVTAVDEPGVVEFRVEATFENGFVDEDYDQVAWSHSNTIAGHLAADGVFTASDSNGGRTWITVEAKA